MTVYADTSFVVSLYVTDRHSGESRQRVQTVPRLWFTPLNHAEWSHAIALLVFRNQMTLSEAQEMHRQLENDLIGGPWVRTEMPDQAFDLCADLARRCGSKLGVRTLDSLHVASALELKSERFWTFDDRQAKLAKAVGLKIS